MSPRLIIVIAACCTLAPDLPGQGVTSHPSNDFIADVIRNVSDSAVAATIRGLEAFGGRSWSNPNRDNVVSWIRTRYQEAGVSDVAVDSFQFSATWQKNVIATIPGTVCADKEILVGGHYDAVSGSPGADDNASGTTAAIEMARVLRAVNYTPRATLRFLAFSAEEAGLKGSADYATKAKTAGRKIVLMQNYDMIGYRDTTQPTRQVYVVWYSGSESEARLDSSIKRAYTTLTPVLTTSYRSGSDSYSFASQGYRAIFNIERNFSPVYHTPQESSTKLDFGYAAEIIKSGLALLLTTDASVTSVESPLAEGATGFTLEQNYPNPFNPTTGVGYQLAVASSVRLVVYDLLGREVAVLVNEPKAPGSYSVRFDATGLASGVYLYRLTTGRYVETRKMLLLR